MLNEPHHALPPELYRRRDHQMAETIPPLCPNGHRLGPDQVLVTWKPCLCQAGHSGHRSWRCQNCDVDLLWPACLKSPEVAHWDGRDVHPGYEDLIDAGPAGQVGAAPAV